MGDVFSHDKARATGHPRDWRKAMSDNVALALIVYTGLQIFLSGVCCQALEQGRKAGIKGLQRPSGQQHGRCVPK